MSGSRRDMRDVVLEDAQASSSSGDDARPPAAPPRRAARGPRRLWLLIGVTVAAVAVAAALDARDDDAPADLRGLPGALAPVDGPVREVWRTDGLVLWDGTRVDGLLVGAAHSGAGQVDAVGLDEATGAVTWRTPLITDGDRAGGATCAVPDAEGARDDRSAAAGSPATPERVVVGRVVACAVVDDVAPVDDGGPAATYQPTASRLLLLDAATGTVLREEAAVPGTAVDALGADLVLSHVDAADHLVVHRIGAGAGAVRWTFTSPEPLAPSTSGRWATVAVQDGLVVAGGDAGWILSPDGRQIHAWQPSPTGAGWVDLLPGGLVVEPGEPGEQGEQGDEESRLLDPLTSSTFVVRGRPLPVLVDDGSAGDVVLARTVADELTAYDAGTGDARWTVPGAGTSAAGPVVDGRVVVTRGDGLAALDARTGQTLWQADDVVPMGQFPVLTDGRLLLCVVAADDGAPVLGGYGLDDGRLRWEVDLPADVHGLAVVDGRLFGYADDGLVAFG